MMRNMPKLMIKHADLGMIWDVLDEIWGCFGMFWMIFMINYNGMLMQMMISQNNWGPMAAPYIWDFIDDLYRKYVDLDDK